MCLFNFNTRLSKNIRNLLCGTLPTVHDIVWHFFLSFYWFHLKNKIDSALKKKQLNKILNIFLKVNSTIESKMFKFRIRATPLRFYMLKSFQQIPYLRNVTHYYQKSNPYVQSQIFAFLHQHHQTKKLSLSSIFS